MGKPMRAGTVTYDNFNMEGQLGSYFGRSLQPHLQDDDCKRAVSIDLRPDLTPDERGALDDYQDITADDMIAGLARHCSPTDLAKLETITDTSNALRTFEPAQFDLAFIDGEHTNVAAFRDVLNVLRVMRPNGVICFDDTTLVLTGIRNALTVMDAHGIPHAMASARGEITIIALGQGAQEFIDALEPDMHRPEVRVERSARRRMSEAVLRETRPSLLLDDKDLQKKIVRARRDDGWDVKRTKKDQLV